MKPLFFGILCACLCAAILLYGSAWQLSAVLFIIISILCGRREKQLLNPFYLVIPMFISYGLYTTKMGHRILTTLDLNGHLLIICSFAALILGFLTIKMTKWKPILVKNYNESFGTVMIIGLIPTIVSLIIIGNPMTMEGEGVLEAKNNFVLPGIGQLAYFLQASIIIAAKNNNSKQLWVAIGLSLIVTIISVTKTMMLMTVIFMTVAFVKFKPDILKSTVAKVLKKYVWVLLPGIILGAFMFNNSVRKEAAGNERSYVKLEKPELFHSNSDLAQGLYMNYLYFCSPWGNMQYNLNRNHKHGDGANTFAQFAKKVGVELDVVEKKEPAYLNTHSYITDFYLDFGYIGAIIASYVLGCIIFFCYRRYGLSNDAMLLSFYALICYATVMLFFSNHFIIGYLLNYYITFGGYYLVMHRFKLRKI